MDDGGQTFELLRLTCLYIEAGYSRAQAERWARMELGLKANAEEEKDRAEDKEGIYR